MLEELNWPMRPHLKVRGQSHGQSRCKRQREKKAEEKGNQADGQAIKTSDGVQTGDGVQTRYAATTGANR